MTRETKKINISDSLTQRIWWTATTKACMHASIFACVCGFFFIYLIDEATDPEETHFTGHCYSCSRWTCSSIGHRKKNNAALKTWGQSLNTRRNALLFSLLISTPGEVWLGGYQAQKGSLLCNAAVGNHKETSLLGSDLHHLTASYTFLFWLVHAIETSLKTVRQDWSEIVVVGLNVGYSLKPGVSGAGKKVHGNIQSSAGQTND